jgi:hypothetical protein
MENVCDASRILHPPPKPFHLNGPRKTPPEYLQHRRLPPLPDLFEIEEMIQSKSTPQWQTSKSTHQWQMPTPQWQTSKSTPQWQMPTPQWQMSKSTPQWQTPTPQWQMSKSTPQWQTSKSTHQWQTKTPASGQPSTLRSAPISTIPTPEWTYNHPILPSADNETWPTNLIDIIRAIQKIPPRQPTQPEFLFELMDEAAEKNYLTLMQKYNGDLASLLEAQCKSTVGYGSEFRNINTLSKIYERHPNWNRMSKILTNGSE